MTMTEVATFRMVAKCGACKTAHAEDIPEREVQDFFYQTSIRGGGDMAYRSCKTCGRGLHVWKRIVGKVNEAVRCDARCTSAKGSDCECSCGGHHHGEDNL